MGRHFPIQQVKVLMRHSTIKLIADLYTDLGMEDMAEGAWTLRELFLVGDQTAFHTAPSGNKKRTHGLTCRESLSGAERTGFSQALAASLCQSGGFGGKLQH